MGEYDHAAGSGPFVRAPRARRRAAARIVAAVALILLAAALAPGAVVCPNCATENSDAANFCRSCGAALKAELVCANCGQRNLPGNEFCGGCGARLQGTETGTQPLLRPTEKVMPAPECNPGAVVWRTPSPPEAPQAGDVWVCAKDGKEMVFVPVGEFVMGRQAPEPQGGSPTRRMERDDSPPRQVDVDAFWIDRTEVTNAEYKRFLDATGHRPPTGRAWTGRDHSPGLGQHPVAGVSWEDAVAYANWVGKRLPTEAEWEKAARGTDGRKHPWGNEPVNADGVWRCNVWGTADGFEWTAPVGSLPSGASPYGCLDMAGNVREWCGDWYAETYYQLGPSRGPQGPASGRERVVRGGACWYEDYVGLSWTCSDRHYMSPGLSGSGTGFRCVLSANAGGRERGTADSKAPIRLEGIVVGSPAMAVLRRGDRNHYVQVGDRFEGYRVVEIRGDSVVLATESGERLVLRVGR